MTQGKLSQAPAYQSAQSQSLEVQVSTGIPSLHSLPVSSPASFPDSLSASFSALFPSRKLMAPLALLAMLGLSTGVGGCAGSSRSFAYSSAPNTLPNENAPQCYCAALPKYTPSSLCYSVCKQGNPREYDNYRDPNQFPMRR